MTRLAPPRRSTLSLLAIIFAASAAFAAAAPAPLGVSYPADRGGYQHADDYLARAQSLGFHVVSFVPDYPYPHLNQIDFSQAPTFEELGAAVEAALRRGLMVVLKPHLEPAMYQPGFDTLKSDNDSWRARTGWRGFFDVDPLTPDYQDQLIFRSLAMLKDVLVRLDQDHPVPRPQPIRLELGTELMDSVVYQPERWVKLLAAARKERDRLGLRGRVLLSHNFSHHFEMPEDFVLRMTPAGRRALARYIKGLDAMALSQYMDLTAAMPADQRDHRLPTVAEVADALVLHEKNLREVVLQKSLGLAPSEIPPLHIGEFGVGRGGLRHPNLWEGVAGGQDAERLAVEIALGHRGLLEYLKREPGRSAQSAVLWVTGRYYDIFGWQSPEYAQPLAATAVAPTWGVAESLGGRPDGFDDFWDRTLQQLAAVPMDLRLRPAPEQSDAKVRCYRAEYSSLDRVRIHAWYCRPAAPGQYPAVLINPWYGRSTVTPPQDAARRGFAALAYQGRGFGVDQSSYPIENSWYILQGIDSPETYVYRQMFCHAKRGVDVLASRPEVDVQRIGAAGSSQGGGLSLAVAALDPRVAAVSADFPFLCDFRTSLPIALSPFQNIHDLMQREPGRRVAVGRTVSYFDLLHFAPRIKAPVKVQIGLHDRTCPPEGIRRVFERIAGSKSLEEWPQADHMDENSLRAETMMDFLYARLGGK